MSGGLFLFAERGIVAVLAQVAPVRLQTGTGSLAGDAATARGADRASGGLVEALVYGAPGGVPGAVWIIAAALVLAGAAWMVLALARRWRGGASGLSAEAVSGTHAMVHAGGARGLAGAGDDVARAFDALARSMRLSPATRRTLEMLAGGSSAGNGGAPGGTRVPPVALMLSRAAFELRAGATPGVHPAELERARVELGFAFGPRRGVRVRLRERLAGAGARFRARLGARAGALWRRPGKRTAKANAARGADAKRGQGAVRGQAPARAGNSAASAARAPLSASGPQRPAARAGAAGASRAGPAAPPRAGGGPGRGPGAGPA